MYWFGKFLDWSTARDALPGADPDNDGKTNLEEYQSRTDPLKAAAVSGESGPYRVRRSDVPRFTGCV